MTPILPALVAIALALALGCAERTLVPMSEAGRAPAATTLTSTTSPATFSRDVSPLVVGEAAPGFELQALDGGEVSLEGLRGNVVVLNFWASWCQPCRQEMPDFQQAWEEHRDQGVVFLGVAVDDTELEASRFAQQVGVTYPLALDQTGDVARAYRIQGVPSTYFIDRQGNLATSLSGLANQGALRIFLRGQVGDR